ncbi:crotonase/enoyl-CoA hydratase family protein [Methylotenera sp.]|uniref:crotonase/enoyl-CoA hydratase family protein n=1 Tax=Methylotenera sp. TaxID=2051956 RepID=UPI002725DA2D|nr:crotonase/enoyl-CoA hydratase family protein [Methylotenera sp.]MDO9206442.1 crotonase/enoyl-CoA hydratase family protein [Methylotenera sp.]MDP1523285.1 crotonase/enoyl-CoA hydratase family protein [Methylotenera sp.]MDP3942772.1 crotonase/enoyl-CoA hydratase family protein [Methylotenera sp.]
MNTIVDFQQFNNATLEQVRTRFEEEFGVMTYFMNPAPRPCFNKICMSELHQSQTSLEKMQGEVIANGKVSQANYLVLASDIPGIFNLGGDLSVFGDLIRAKARDHLLAYAKLCVNNVWTFYNMQAPVTTISLVQGQAMGGGFEAALAAHIMVAEKSALMGLPEVLFNLFPGMGALSFLSRKIGMPAAEKMVRSGKIYTGEELYQLGVVDVLAEDGQGEYALNNWIKKHHRSLNSFQAINRAKQRVNPLTIEELYDITEIWVDAALRLDERNLKVMERLVRAQNSKVNSDVAHIQEKQSA